LRALAFRADAEELESVLDIGVAVVAGESGFDFGEDALIESDDAFAAPAPEVVVMMAARIVVGDLEAGDAVAEVDAADEAHALEERQGSIDGGRVAGVPAEGFDDFPGCGRSLQSHERIQDDLTRLGDAACLVSQTFHPLGRGRMVAAADSLRRLHPWGQGKGPATGIQGERKVRRGDRVCSRCL